MALNTFDPMVIAALISDCVCAALVEQNPDVEVACCIRPGSQISFDSCPEDGTVNSWVALQSGYPTITFPNQDASSTTTSCDQGTSMALAYEIGVVRGACSDFCACDIAEATAAQIFGDLNAVLKALACCLDLADPYDQDDKNWRLQNFALFGPEGGCAGVKINILVHAAFPCC